MTIRAGLACWRCLRQVFGSPAEALREAQKVEKRLAEECEKLHKKMGEEQNVFDNDVYEMEKTVKQLGSSCRLPQTTR